MACFHMIILVGRRSAPERFFNGPRFGRSGSSHDIQTRNPERFFTGTRYGKRSNGHDLGNCELNFFVICLFVPNRYFIYAIRCR